MAESSMNFSSFSNIVDGALRGGNNLYYGKDPTTKQALPYGAPVATRADLDDAVRSAKVAFQTWSKTTFDERRSMLLAFAKHFSSHEEDFARLLAKENGKPMVIASGEVQMVTQFLNFTSNLTTGDEKYVDDDKTIIVRRVPLGVVGAICPWNCLLRTELERKRDLMILAAGKIGPALMAGNCVIVKPSPFSPYTALKLVELSQSIFPPGVLQVLGGHDDLGPWMVEHDGIQKISFTGSLQTGKVVMRSASATLKRLTLELSGNDACIVLPDVDIAQAAAGVASGSFYNTGQGCIVAKRIYVHQDIYSEFLAAFVAAVKQLKVGQPDEEGVMIGPLQNMMQYEKVKDLVNDCVANGYKFALGGAVAESKGYFINPCIIDNPPDDSRIITEEAFGPIVPVQPWTSEEEVINRANATTTGLGGSVWSKNIGHAEEIAKRIESGTVWINAMLRVDPKAVISGHKSSGLGSEFGVDALNSFSNTQSLVIYKQ